MAMPLSIDEQPDHLEDRPALATQNKEPKQHGGQHPTGTSATAVAPTKAATPRSGREGQNDQRRRGDQRGRDIDRGLEFPG